MTPCQVSWCRRPATITGLCMSCAERLADRLVREFVFERDGNRCVVATPYHAGPLDPAHIRRRGFSGTRWDPANLLTLCRLHHSYFTEHPNEWDDFVCSVIGVEAFENLRRKSLRNDVRARQLVESVIEAAEQRERGQGVLS